MTDPIVPAAGSRARRPARPLILTLLALAALGGAGWSIWRSVGEEALEAIAAATRRPPAPVPPTAPGIPPVGDDETANWTEVAVYRAGPGRPRPVLVARRTRQAIAFNDGVARGLLARELVRQGLILAAREGFDVAVRDLAVGDPDEPGAADATYRLGSFGMAGKHASSATPQGMRVTIASGTGADRRVLWTGKLDGIGREMPEYDQLVGQIKALIDKDFRDVLAGWKLPPSVAPRAAVAPDRLPDGVEGRLASLAEAEQFAALRALHDAVRRDGGSPARWRALARGYAMLGSLTEPLFGAGHAAFQARGLLYARLGVDAAKRAPAGLRDQAFAEALAGIFGPARADLDAADKLDGGQTPSPRADLLRAFLATDPTALIRAADRSQGDHIALYLGAVVQSRLSGRVGGEDRINRHEILDAAERVLTQVPDAHRAIDLMSEAGGVVNLHRSTTLDLEAFAATAATRIRAVPGLPPAVADLVREGAPADEVAARRALDEAARADPNDLTWGALAQVLRETRFLQVCRRLHFLAFALSAGASDFAEEARPLVADHPNRDFVELYAGQLAPADAAVLARRLDFADLEFKNHGLLHIIRRFDPGLDAQLYQRSMSQAGMGLIPDWERTIRNENEGPGRRNWARALIQVEPASPVARSALVGVDWDNVAARAPDWEREQPWNTSLIAEIAGQLLKAGRYDEAQRRFEVALRQSPEMWIFRGLARCYRERGQTEAWVAAAEAMLEQPDQSLDHATVGDDLAKYLIEQGQVDRAWPWAERAAGSWAAWAMDTAARCAEMRRDWENAEAWVARNSQRYPDRWLNWATWCLRTEHGHPRAAARLVWAQWDAGRRGTSDEESVWLCDLGLLLDRPEVARESAAGLLEAEPGSTVAALKLALACHRLGDAKGRDEAMERLASAPNPLGPRTAKALGLLHAWHREGEKAPPDLAPVAAILESIPAENRPPTAGAIGLVLDMYGRTAEAIPYLKQGDSRQQTASQRALIRMALKAHDQPLAADIYWTAPAPPDPAAKPAPPRP